MKLHLQTGGKAMPGRQNLFKLTASAAQEHPPRYRPDGGLVDDNYTMFTTPIAAQDIKVAGKALGGDGNLWIALPDNQTIDVTPKVKDVNDYTFSIDEQRYKLNIVVNGSNPLWPDHVASYNHYCVGQKLNFEAVFNPSVSGLVSASPTWSYTADYVNNHWTDANGCEEYNIAPIPAMSNPTTAWFYNKQTQDATANLGLYCQFSNGQTVYLVRQGMFNVFTPSVAWSPSVLYGGFNVIGGFLWLSLGTPSGENDGAADFSADINSKFPGDIGITQMVNGDEGSGFPDDLISTGGNLFFDGSILYVQTQKNLLDRGYGVFERATDLTDCPGTLVGNNYTSIHLKFNDFVRFCPSGSDSIWVTLGRADWGWDAEASYDSSGNAILPLNNPTQPVFILSNQFPPPCAGIKGTMSRIKDLAWYLLFGAP